MIFIETQRYVKGFSSKHIALKVDVTGAESILFAGASVHLSARSFTGWAVKGLKKSRPVPVPCRFWCWLLDVTVGVSTGQCFILTPSLPWYHLKTSDKRAKLEILNCFCLIFSDCYVKGFSSKHIPLKVDVLGAENILFACASVHLSARKFYRLGQ